MLLYKTDFFLQRMQCTRTDKEDSLSLIEPLYLFFNAYRRGINDLDGLLKNEAWIELSPPILLKAGELFTIAKESAQLQQVLYNTIVASNYTGRQCFQAVVVTETVMAIFEQYTSDYIFTFLVPSFFSMALERQAVERYNALKKSNSNN